MNGYQLTSGMPPSVPSSLGEVGPPTANVTWRFLVGISCQPSPKLVRYLWLGYGITNNRMVGVADASCGRA
jgi:hypothetical protein